MSFIKNIQLIGICFLLFASTLSCRSDNEIIVEEEIPEEQTENEIPVSLTPIVVAVDVINFYRATVAWEASTSSDGNTVVYDM